MNLQFTQSINSKSIIIPISDDKIPQGLIKKLTGQKKINTLPNKFGTFRTIPGHTDDSIIYLLHLGNEDDQHRIWTAFRDLAMAVKDEWKNDVLVYAKDTNTHLLNEAVYGISMAAYKLGAYKSGPAATSGIYKHDFSISIFHKSDRKLEKQLNDALTLSDTQKRIMTLVDTPANIKTPEYIARWAVDSAKQFGYQAQIFYKHDLMNEGLQALLAVGQGSQHPPVMIQLEYYPAGKKNSRPHIGLVGKGVTFDTGGISIKPSANMHYMKSDMGGAAAVLGAMEAAARLKLDIHLVALIPCAENSVDALSVRPGDVIQSYSKKSIEVIDTDAEGRLILADAISYMKHNYFPGCIIDLATLTGSSVRTLGYAAGALFSNNAALAEDLENAGQRVFERVWPLPLWKDYEEDIQSDIADVKNFSGKPVAGAISAAKFLEFFVEDHPKWAHIDIAGVAFGNTPYGKMKSATGFGVRLIIEYCRQIINS